MCGSWGHLQPGQGDSLKTGTRSLWKLGPIEAVRSTAEDSGKNVYAVKQHEKGKDALHTLVALISGDQRV